MSSNPSMTEALDSGGVVTEPAPNPVEGCLNLGREGEQEMGDGLASAAAVGAEVVNDVMSREVAIDATLSGLRNDCMVGAPNSAAILVESVENSSGAEVEVGVAACEKENLGKDSATGHYWVGGFVRSEAVETESMVGTARGPAVEGVKTEFSSAVQLEAVRVCNGTEHAEEDVTFPAKNLISVNHAAGNGKNQADVVVDFIAETENMSAGLSAGIDKEADSQTMVRETEMGNGSTVDSYQETSVSQTSLVDAERSIWQESNLILGDKAQKMEPVLDDNTTVDLADSVLKYSNIANPGVEVQKQDLPPIDDNPVVEAGCRDGYLVNDDCVDSGGFVMTNLSSVKAVKGIQEQSAGTYPVDENLMEKGDTFVAVVGSVAVVQDVESQSRDDNIISNIGEQVVGTSCLAVETQAAVKCSIGEKLMEKGDFEKIGMLEASGPSLVQIFASDGKSSFDSPLGVNQEMGAPSIGSLVDGSPSANTHEVQSSLGRSQMVVESNVLKEHSLAPDEREEPVQNSDSEQQTPALWDSMADVVMYADTMQIGDQELLENSKKQILQCTTVVPWTLCVENSHRARYNLPPQDTAQFVVSDLVWGKVKSHPWWPGQIFDHSDASELALKHQRKDNFLIAYFGDKTFAWRNESQLKHFHTNFSQMEKQSSSDVFISAVNDVLGEVSRRMELGMTCSCLPEEDYADISHQKVENAGIQEGTDYSFVDRSVVVNYFQPNRFLEYIKALAQIPTGGADRLELVIAKAQLKAFYRSKGYPELPEFVFGGGLMLNDVEIPPPCDKIHTEVAVEHSTLMSSESIPVKRKRGRPPKKHEQILEDGVERSTPLSSESILVKRKRGRPPKKLKQILEDGRNQKRLSELMEEKNVSYLADGAKSVPGVKAAGVLNSHSYGKECKIGDSDSADSGKTKEKSLETKSPSSILGGSFEVGVCIGDSIGSKKKRRDSLGDIGTKLPSPALNSSFKVGEYIRRVASQLTGSPPILKCQGETFQKSVSKGDYRGGYVVTTDDFPCTPVLKRKAKKGFSEDYSSPEELLSQLHLASRDPLKPYSFLSMAVSFFTDFRNSCTSSSSEHGEPSEKMGVKRGRKKAVGSESDSSYISTPDYMDDSYWSDMISHNSSGKGIQSNGLKRKGETDLQKQRKKRNSVGLLASSCLLDPVMETAQLQFGTLSPNMKPISASERPIISVEDKIVDTPTALILSFNSLDSLPSEADLVRIFGRYGPLREAETEVLRKNNRVKVVFKRRADAEIAFSSAGKFSIFGPALVSYRLIYLPSAPKKSSDTLTQGENYAAPTDDGNLEVSAQAEIGVVFNTAEVEDVGKGLLD